MSKNDELTVNVVTPDGSVYEGKTTLVICTTTKGQIGIMPNRLPLLATLAIDKIKVRKDDGTYEEVAVSGGFIEFSNNLLSVVANAAEKADDIDVTRAEHARDRAQARIKKAKEEKNADDLKRAEVALKRAINRINISQH